MATAPSASVGVGIGLVNNSSSMSSMTALGVGAPSLALPGSMLGIQQQRASFASSSAAVPTADAADEDDHLTTLPDIDETLTAYNVTLSKITSPRQSQLALEYLTGGGPSQESILARAGMIAIDLEGQLTLPQFSIPTYSSTAAASSSSAQDLADPLTSSTFTGIHSVQIAVPLAHLAVHLPLNSLYSSPQPPTADLRPPVHVFYWHLEPAHLTATDKQAMMQHIKAILHYPGCTTIAHCKAGDEQALFMQHGIHLRPPIVDTQRMYLQWTQLSWRVQKAWQVVSECAMEAATGVSVFAVPSLNERYLVPTHVPLPPNSSDDVPPAPDPHSTEGALHTSSLYTPLAEPLGDPGAGLNDVLTACHLPINPLKKRSGSKSDAAQFRYAVWDVAFLCQAYWHMSTALAYLSVQLVSMQSLSPLNLSTRPTSPWTGPLDLSSSASTSLPPPPNDHPLVLAIAHLIHSLGQPTPHPSSLTSTPAPLAADLAAIDAAFARKTSVPVRQRLSQRTGGVRQVIVDYPQYFRAWRVESGLDPAAASAGQPVVWVSVVRMPPDLPGVDAVVPTQQSAGAPAAAPARAGAAGTPPGRRRFHGYTRAERIKVDLFGDQDARKVDGRHGGGGGGGVGGRHGPRPGAAAYVGTGGSARQQQARVRTQVVAVDEERADEEMFDEHGNWIGDGRKRTGGGGEGEGIVGGVKEMAISPGCVDVCVGGAGANQPGGKTTGEDDVDDSL